MTTTLPAPAVKVERASREHVAALMLKAVRDHGLSWPRDIHHMEGADSGDLLDIGIDGRGPWLGWVDYFGEPEYRSGLSVHIPWRGWTVLLSYREVATTDAETAALIDEVTYEPLCFWRGCSEPQVPPFAYCAEHYVPPCASCGGDVVHRAGCPSEPEHLADHYAAIAAAGICMYCPTVLALTADGRIAEHETADANGTPCAGSGEWPATDWNDEEIPKGSVVDLADFLAARWPARVDPEAAAEIPALVLDVTPNPAPSAEIDDTIAALTADIDEPIPYTPAPMPTGKQANAAECARLDAETQDAVLTAEQRHCHTIDVVTVDPELVDDGRGDPGMAHLMAVPAEPPLPPQVLFAEAAERLAHAMLAEASE